MKVIKKIANGSLFNSAKTPFKAIISMREKGKKGKKKERKRKRKRRKFRKRFSVVSFLFF